MSRKWIISLGMGLFLCFQMTFMQPLTTFSKENMTDMPVQSNFKAMKINYTVKGRDVYVECIVPGFSFVSDGEKSNRKDGEGHIHVYANGKKIEDVNQAAFIIKGLPKGTHEITLQFVHNNQQPYQYHEKFTVDIK